MRVETDHVEVAAALQKLASLVTQADGTVAPDFTVREKSGQFSAHVDPTEQRRIVVEYPLEIRPPMAALQWQDNTEDLIPTGGFELFSSLQRNILDTWLTLVNATNKLAHIRRVVPRFAVRNWSLRHHLAQAGYPIMNDVPDLASAPDVLVAWHSGSARSALEIVSHASSTSGQTQATDEIPTKDADHRVRRLIPLKCFVNHHPAGANQQPLHRRVAVASATPTGTDETFESYGDLDAMQLLMNFGYLDDSAPLVHSVPVEIESIHLGRVVVRQRAPRTPRDRSNMTRDVPEVRSTDEGLDLHHLTLRPDNRGRVAALLAMAIQARAGVTPGTALIEAEAVLDDVTTANLEYYRTLDELVVQATANPAEPGVEGSGTDEILPTIAAVSHIQQRGITMMWGQ